MEMRDQIISEIRRIASENGGKPPGVKAFATKTGITEWKWRGVFWTRWENALADAGLPPNALQGRLDSDAMLLKVAELCRRLGRLPTRAEIKLRRKSDPTFPSHGAVANHFPTNADFVLALRKLAATEGYGDLLPMLPAEAKPQEPRQSRANEGSVYLLKSGNHYKIGRSDDLERRVKEVRIALPDSVTLVHTIQTDDPPGIEAYWHRRFADRRANGEWFRLTGDDVRAFRRRKFQ